MLSTYFWMLCEGAYLHLLLKYTWGVKQWQMWCLVTAGWTLPAVSIIPYTYCRTEKNTCGIAEPISKEKERYVNKMLDERFRIEVSQSHFQMSKYDSN